MPPRRRDRRVRREDEQRLEHVHQQQPEARADQRAGDQPAQRDEAASPRISSCNRLERRPWARRTTYSRRRCSIRPKTKMAITAALIARV